MDILVKILGECCQIGVVVLILWFLSNLIAAGPKSVTMTVEVDHSKTDTTPELDTILPNIPFEIKFSDGFVMKVTEMQEKGVFLDNKWQPIFLILPTYPIQISGTDITLPVLEVLMTAGSVREL